MTTVYKLCHYDGEADDGIDYYKLIGVYSSEERARQAIERLRDKPGFRELPDGWSIGDVVLDKDDAWADGFVTIINGEEYVKEGR